MLIQITVFVTYILFIMKRYGIQKSISHSWYKLGSHWYLFTLLTWGLGLPLIWMDKSPLLSASGVLMCFTGVAGAIKMDKVIHIIHYTASACAIIFCFVYISVNVSVLPVIVMASFILFLLIRKAAFSELTPFKNTIWWIEVLAFTLIEVGLYLG